MPRPRWPHLHHEQTRHGNFVWYVRVDKGPRKRIKEQFGTPAFERAYQAALGRTSEAAKPQTKAQNGSITWAVRLYMKSKAWSDLSPATRKQRGCILRKMEQSELGKDRLKAMTRSDILKSCKKREATPSAARHYVQTVRGLFAWAIDEDLATSDPTAGVIAKSAKSEGHLAWTDKDVEAFEKRWPLGTRERVAFDVLLWTGLRRGDAVRVGRPHVKDGIIVLKTEKTGQEVYVVMCEALRRSIEAGPCGDLTFIAGVRGLPRVKESFGEWFRAACHAAGVEKTAHGLRKAAATRVANNGATEKQLEAIFGWSGGRMASLYTKNSDRRRVALAAAGLLAGPESGTSIPAPIFQRPHLTGSA